MWGGEAEKPEYKSLNPAGTVPFLVADEHFTLFQGSCIMKYICERYDLRDDVGELLYPKDNLKKRAKIDQWLFWQHLNVRSAGGALIHISMSKDISRTNSIENAKDVGSTKSSISSNDRSNSVNHSISFKNRRKMYSERKSIEAGESFGDKHMESRGGQLVMGDMSAVNRALVVLNTILEDRPFIGGESYSLADVRIGFELQTLEAERHLKYARFGDVRYDLSDEGRLPPNVEMWMARMLALPGFCDTDGMHELHQKLFAAQETFFTNMKRPQDHASLSEC